MKLTENTLSELETLRKEHLESDIIELLAQRMNVPTATAMDLYYHSRLAAQVAAGAYGIEQLDAAYLVDDLMQYEPELFSKASGHC